MRALRLFARELLRLGTIVISVYRDSGITRFQEFADLLADPLIRDCNRLSLVGFDDQEIRQFVESRTASPLTDLKLEKIIALTGGNPRLLDIVLRHHLLEEKPLQSGKWLRGFLRAEIEVHLEYLTEQAKEVLRTASLNGSEFRFSTLVHVLEQSPGELLDCLQEAEQSGLLQRSEIPGTYRFRQTLVQEIFCAELTGAKRARLHKRFGEVLEAMYPDDHTMVEKVARHFYEAAALGCAAKAADYCSRAGAQAYSGSRWDDAWEFYQMALVGLELQASDPDGIREVKVRLEDIGERRAREISPEGALSNVNAGTNEDENAAADRGGTPAPTAMSAPSAGAEFLERGPLIDPNPSSRAGADDSDRTSDAFTRAEVKTDTLTLKSTGVDSSTHIESSFRREGDFWTLSFEERTLHVRHSNGLVFAAHLLRHPDHDFHVAQLVALLPSREIKQFEPAYISHSEKERLGMHTISKNSNPLLDATAKAEYRRRIVELRDALEDAKSLNNTEKAAKLEEELEFIALELSRAVGSGGRDRKHRAENERARVNVTNAIRALTAKVAKEHPSFGRYLRVTIQTGLFCSYRPDPRFTPQWRF